MLGVVGASLLAWYATEVIARRARPDALAVAALGWVVASALSAAFSSAPRLSLFGEPGQREGLVTAIALAGLHVAARHAHRGEAQVRTTLTVLLGAGVVAAAHAQLQLAGLDPFRWQGLHTYVTPGGAVLRPGGPLGNPILLGAVLAAVWPVALVRLAGARGDATRLVPASMLVAASLLATLSRGAWLAAAIATTMSLVLAWRAGAPWPRMAWTTALSLAPAALLGVTRASGAIAQRIAESASGAASTTRELIAGAAWRLWREHPLLGVGPDAFGLAFPRVQSPEFWRAEWIGVPLHAHSVPLQVLATLGLAGLLAGAAWMLAAGVAWRRAWRAAPAARFTLAAIAAALVALAIAGATNVVGLAGATMFAVLTALIPAAGTPSDRGEGVTSRGVSTLSMVATTIAFAIAFLAGVRALRASALAANARTAVAAARLAPGEESYWRIACDASLAEAEASGADARARLATAEDAARHAIALVPVRAANHERLARALAMRALRTRDRGTADSADARFERATHLAPADGWLLVSWIRFHLAAREGARAHELAQHLVALYPEAAVGHAMSGAASLLLGREDDAYAELKRAQAARWEEDAGPQRAEVDRLVTRLERGRPTDSPRP